MENIKQVKRKTINTIIKFRTIAFLFANYNHLEYLVEQSLFLEPKEPKFLNLFAPHFPLKRNNV